MIGNFDRWVLALVVIVALSELLGMGLPYLVCCGLLGLWAGNAKRGSE